MSSNISRSTVKVYLDYNATTPLEPEVLEEITLALRDAWGNPSSTHDAGLKAKSIISTARKHVANMVNAKPSDIIFTSGGTETNNWILQMAARHYKETFDCDKLGQLPHFVTSNLEHDSVKTVVEEMKNRKLADVTYICASKSMGVVAAADVLAAIRPSTVLVSIMMANNESGIIQPIAEISEAIKKMKRSSGETTRIFIHTDAAQAIGKVKVDVEELGVDFLTIVGHKFYGPRIGAMYVRGPQHETPIYPMMFGGGQENNLRSGTENTGMIAGLGKAAELVHNKLPNYEKHFKEIRDYLEQQLKARFEDDVVFNGKFTNSERLPNTCNMSFIRSGLTGHRVLTEVDHLQASVGAACHAQNKPSPILLAIGVDPQIAANAIRLSIGRETTREDIDLVIQDLKRAVDKITSKT